MRLLSSWVLGHEQAACSVKGKQLCNMSIDILLLFVIVGNVIYIFILDTSNPYMIITNNNSPYSR